MVKRLGLVLFMLIFNFYSGTVFADTINLWSSFPNTQGNNNIYALAWSQSGGYRQLEDVGDYSFFTPSHSWSIPYIFKADDHIRMHPQGTNNGLEELAVVGYEISADNSYDITGQFLMYGYGNIYVDIYKNNNVLWSGASLGYTNTAAFDLQDISLNVGDFLYFRVSPNGGDADDWGGLRAEVSSSPVPEPVSFVLFGTGVVGLIAARRRKKAC